MGNKMAKQANCSVCFERTKAGDLIKLNETCQHEFCRSCLLRWFHTSVSCPKCRQDVHEKDIFRVTGGRPLTRAQDTDQEQAPNNLIDEFTLTWLQENDARQCPGCKNWIVRSAGCDNMKCRCGLNFNFGRESSPRTGMVDLILSSRRTGPTDTQPWYRFFA